MASNSSLCSNCRRVHELVDHLLAEQRSGYDAGGGLGFRHGYHLLDNVLELIDDPTAHIDEGRVVHSRPRAHSDK